MNQANTANINMAAIHRRMSGRHCRKYSIKVLFMFHHMLPKPQFVWVDPGNGAI
jgi:hypothetical protein